ncbi:MAG TPA: ATP-binding cassette domain-containing protein, partial [Atribacterota bacterium]|nr:ATP-binding cassette domain-containing protein [Atribacterota bacterium]
MDDCLLKIKDLDVIYMTDEATVNAVNSISFKLNKKENLGLVGETGAGKTTTALSIMGLLPMNIGKIPKGEIFFHDVDLLRL